jgi:hypothetical protein
LKSLANSPLQLREQRGAQQRHGFPLAERAKFPHRSGGCAPFGVGGTLLVWRGVPILIRTAI